MNILRFLIPKSRVAYLEKTASVRNGLEKMRHHSYTALPVIASDGTYAGTVTEGDFLWQAIGQGASHIKDLEECRISDLIRPDWNPPVSASCTVEELFSRLMEQNFVPVVDDRGVFVGIVTRKAILGNCVLLSDINALQGVHILETI